MAPRLYELACNLGSEEKGYKNLPSTQPGGCLDITRNVPQQQTFALGKSLLSHWPTVTGVDSERPIRKLFNTCLFSPVILRQGRDRSLQWLNHTSKPACVTPGWQRSLGTRRLFQILWGAEAHGATALNTELEDMNRGHAVQVWPRASCHTSLSLGHVK